MDLEIRSQFTVVSYKEFGDFDEEDLPPIRVKAADTQARRKLSHQPSFTEGFDDLNSLEMTDKNESDRQFHSVNRQARRSTTSANV